MSALSSQLGSGPGPLPTGDGSSTCIPLPLLPPSASGVAAFVSPEAAGAGAGGVSESGEPPQLPGTKAGAFTLGTKDGALTLRAFILPLTSISSSSQFSGAPLVAMATVGLLRGGVGE